MQCIRAPTFVPVSAFCKPLCEDAQGCGEPGGRDDGWRRGSDLGVAVEEGTAPVVNADVPLVDLVHGHRDEEGDEAQYDCRGKDDGHACLFSLLLLPLPGVFLLSLTAVSLASCLEASWSAATGLSQPSAALVAAEKVTWQCHLLCLLALHWTCRR